MIDLIYRRLLIPAFESGIKRRKTFAYWRQLERSQWLGPDKLRDLQLAALQKLLAHAGASCPYYRDAWQTLGFDPQEVYSIADFQRWPVIDRETIRQNRGQMRIESARMQLMKKATGGSSGVPLEFDLNADSNDRRMGAWHRGYGWAGAAPGTRQWHLWGGGGGNPSPVKRAKDALYHRLYRRSMANSFGLSESRVPLYLEQLNRCRPHSIVAYTNPLYFFARALAERGLVPYSPRSIVVGAEKLHDFQRESIERVFRAPVFETYGSREFMLIGGECEEHAGLHLTAENLLVEILDDDGRPTPDGEEGNVVITDLTNYGMPFVRYANGDRAIAGNETCRCGRGLPLLKKVVGRRLDMLETADGRQIPGEFFPHLMKEYASIRRFQIVQEELSTIQVRLVVNSNWSSANENSLEQQIRAVAGDCVTLDIKVVDEIPLTPAGKLQVVVRRVARRGKHDASVIRD
ncbi:MAG TPA: phenylacetate--CoA ligase family protein [Planctomycetaceae bacterium]